MKKGVIYEDIYHGGEPDNDTFSKAWKTFLFLVLLYTAFQAGRYINQVNKNESFNTGYISGAYNVTAYLIECHNVKDEQVHAEYVKYAQLAKGLGKGEFVEYPCEE